MANYSTLKASVNAYIKANGVRAITGPVLNGILTQMINTLGDGARYGGIATPSGNPGAHDNVVFFAATAAGTYTNYGGFTLDGSTLHVFVYDGTWADVDTGVPTSTAFATKADKDEDAVEGNIAKFDANGNPVDAGIAAEKINQLGQEVDELKAEVEGDTVISETEYSNPGYISITDGSIQNTSSTWIHSDLIPIEQFYSAGKFTTHSLVANVAFYSGNSFSSFISGLSGTTALNPYLVDGDVTAESLAQAIPSNATHIAFSTNSADNSLKVKTISSAIGLEQRVETIEITIDALDKSRRTGVSPKMLHFSFDDTISAFYDIVHNNRDSIFDNAFFGALKSLHETYGAVFSCYCFYDYIILNYVSKISTIASPKTNAVYYLGATDGEYTPGYYVYRNAEWTAYLDTMRSDYVLFSLSTMPNTWASEFSAASSWLKFGLHSKDALTNYSNATAEAATTDYDAFISAMMAITGTPNSIDTVVRLQNFAGSLAVCRAFRDADLGVQGFLCSDYSETGGEAGGYSNGYYLTTALGNAVWKKGQYYDTTERLHFYFSGLRMDNISSVNMPTYLAKFLTADKWEQTAMVEMYCHENQMFNEGVGTLTADYTARLQAVCEWAKNNGFTFGYQMDRIRMAF